MTKRWKQRPEGSNWGEFGEDDQRGCLNYITKKEVLLAAAEIQQGLSFPLSLPLDYPGGSGLNPRRKPPILRPTMREGAPNFNATFSDSSDVICDDLVIMHLQYSTQWDALCHVGSRFDADGDGEAEMVYYNGYRGEEDISGPNSVDDAGLKEAMKPQSTSHAAKLGIENAASHGVQGRGVMVDLRARFGDEFAYIGYDNLMATLEQFNVEVEPGDMVCLHTGFAQRVLEMNREPDNDLLHNLCSVLDGRDKKLLNWITDSKLSVLIADNYAVEGYPARPGEDTCCAMLPLHEHCLFKNGIHLGELWHLTPLANWLRENNRTRFMLTAPPLNLPGAVGSPTMPVATV